MGDNHAGSMPTEPSGISNRWWRAGSLTNRMRREQTVIPNCDVASINVACSIAHNAVFAGFKPSSARGSIWLRLAEITANSAATKNALPARRMTSQNKPHQYSLTAAPPPRHEYWG